MERRLGRGGPRGALEAPRANELRAGDPEESGWDGGWYRRAFDDDGDPSVRRRNCGVPHRLHLPVLGGQGETAHNIFSMISPVKRPIERYRVEPYVVAGDISAAEPHAGQGGWTWYSGAAAWTWRLGVEGILGLTLRDGELHVDPCLPPGWGGFTAILRRPGGSIAVEVKDPEGRSAGAAPSLASMASPGRVAG
jgi:cellobiose phosphorylase